MGFLSHLRVVDLTDERGMLVEAPRATILPRFRAAYGAGKRSTTLDLDAAEGRDSR